jgi:hypothetical protein
MLECNPIHNHWKRYGNAVIEALEVLDLIGITQTRPLLLAIFNKFTRDGDKERLTDSCSEWKLSPFPIPQAPPI